MKFVDEAVVTAIAGKGGDGSASFRREKYIPFGGPDGGDGGDGGSIYFVADQNINTLADFRYLRQLKAGNGDIGRGKQCTGYSGEDKIVRVPIGTIVKDLEEDHIIAELTKNQQKILIAKGGRRGLGNLNFKTSTNQAPTKFTKGKEGESKKLHLELKVLADVGLLGLPNAGKSTFIRAISSAKPKVADYPFTTLYPNLGVVSIEKHKSFVVADIPGLIAGAADGHGLGITFLKHLQRTKILLHMVDLLPLDGSSVIDSIKTIEKELKKYEDAKLLEKTRWLVLNKTDIIEQDQQQEIIQKIKTELNWQQPIFCISAISKQGTEDLCYKIYNTISNKA